MGRTVSLAMAVVAPELMSPKKGPGNQQIAITGIVGIGDGPASFFIRLPAPSQQLVLRPDLQVFLRPGPHAVKSGPIVKRHGNEKTVALSLTVRGVSIAGVDDPTVRGDEISLEQPPVATREVEGVKPIPDQQEGSRQQGNRKNRDHHPPGNHHSLPWDDALLLSRR